MGELIYLHYSTNPRFNRCKFKTVDGSAYWIDGLFMSSVVVRVNEELPGDFNDFMDFETKVQRQAQRVADAAEFIFGSPIDSDGMVRWYYDPGIHRVFLRHENDLVLIKLGL